MKVKITMIDVDRIEQKVAAGLRQCEVQPDYLVWTNNRVDLWPTLELHGIPVLVAPFIVDYCPYGDSDLNFIPVWKDNPDVNKLADQFERGYNNDAGY